MDHRKSTSSASDDAATRSILNQDAKSSSSGDRDDTRIQTTETLPAKVDALEEVKNFRNLEDCMTAIDQRFSSLEGMMKQLLELNSLPVPVVVKTELGSAVKEGDVVSKLHTLNILLFDGDDVLGWVSRAEQCFDAHGLTDDEKMVEGTRCLEGEALTWYQQQENRLPFSSWEEFKACLLGRFRGNKAGDLHEQFFAMTQEKTVMEYQEKFVFFSSWLGEISKATLEGTFMRGLKSEIREELRLYEPRSLEQMIGLAQRIEDKIMAVQGRTGTSSDAHKEEQSGGNLKYFTKSEVHGKQADRPCSRGKKKPAKEDSYPNVARLSLFVVEGSSSNLMIFRGAIGDYKVTVAVASRTSHNFISNRVVDKLGIRILKTRSFGVEVVGTGRIEPGQGLCRGFTLDLQVQGIQLREEFIPFDLMKGVDVILGMTWLETLGKIEIYWDDSMVMEFQLGGRLVTLRSDLSLTSTLGR